MHLHTRTLNVHRKFKFETRCLTMPRYYNHLTLEVYQCINVPNNTTKCFKCSSWNSNVGTKSIKLVQVQVAFQRSVPRHLAIGKAHMQIGMEAGFESLTIQALTATQVQTFSSCTRDQCADWLKLTHGTSTEGQGLSKVYDYKYRLTSEQRMRRLHLQPNTLAHRMRSR